MCVQDHGKRILKEKASSRSTELRLEAFAGQGKRNASVTRTDHQAATNGK